MIKKLSRHGDDLALIIDASMLEKLGINEKTALEVSTDGQCLIVSPVVENGLTDEFRRLLEAGNQRYDKALRRLAE